MFAFDRATRVRRPLVIGVAAIVATIATASSGRAHTRDVPFGHPAVAGEQSPWTDYRVLDKNLRIFKGAGGGVLRMRVGVGNDLWFAAVDGNELVSFTTRGVAKPYPIVDPGGNQYPQGIAEATDGRMWFPEVDGGHVDKLSATGATIQYSLGFFPTDAYDLVLGPDGNLWMPTFEHGIVRVTTSGAVTRFALPSHATGMGTITVGPDENLWFISTYGSCFSLPGGGTIGKMTTTGVATIYGVGTAGNSWGIAPGPDGRIWFTDAQCPGDPDGTTGRIGAINTDGTGLVYYTKGITAHPESIVAAPDGNLYFSELGGKIGRITTAGVVTEYPLPGSGPNRFMVYAITIGPDGNVWFHDAGPRIGRLQI